MRNHTVAWLWRTPGRKKGYVAALTAVQVLTGFLNVGFALLLRNVINSAVDRNSGAFWHYAVLLILLTAGSLLLHMINRWLTELSKAQLENLFKQRLTAAILRKEYAAVSAVHSGEWMNRLTNDTRIVAENYTELIPGLSGMGVRLVAAVTMLIVLDRHFAAILLPGGAGMIALSVLLRGALKRLHTRMQESDGKLRIFLQECIGNLMIVKSYAAEEHAEQEAANRMHTHLRDRMRKNNLANLGTSGVAVAINAMYVYGIIYCARGIMSGSVSYGTLTAVMQLIAQIQGPIIGMIVVDYLIVKRRRISLRSLYGLDGHDAYDFTHGFNLVGLACIVIAFVTNILFIYDPLTAEIKSPVFLVLTGSGYTAVCGGLLYWLASLTPLRKYMLRDRSEIDIV